MTLTKIQRFYELLLVMTIKELRIRYKNTFFGFLWIILNPITQMLVIGFVFKFFIREHIENYFLYLLVGLLVWNFFNLSLSKSTPSIVYERQLVKKAKFPNEVIPLSIILSNFIHFIAALILLSISIVFLGILTNYNFLSLILGVVLLLVFTSGLSLLTCSLNVRFRDTNFIVQAMLIVWFYATPIVYSINVIPYKLMWIWRLNPLTSIVQLFQNALVSSPPPELKTLISNVVVIVLVMFLGVQIFKKNDKNFDDWL